MNFSTTTTKDCTTKTETTTTKTTETNRTSRFHDHFYYPSYYPVGKFDWSYHFATKPGAPIPNSFSPGCHSSSQNSYPYCSST